MKVGKINGLKSVALKYPLYGMECAFCVESRKYFKNPFIQTENILGYIIKFGMANLESFKILKEIVQFSDIVHVSYVVHLSAGIASSMTKICRKPLVVTTADSLCGRSFFRDGIKGLIYRMWPKISWKLADKIIAFTQKERKWLESLNIPNEKIEVIP